MRKMKLIPTILSILVLCSEAYATFDSGSTGADGPFSPTASIEVVLPPDGVLNFTTVDIPTGVTVTFKRNAANTPVYMLATGDVTIAGTISVNGSTASFSVPGKSGPGGFDGGISGVANLAGGQGQGPGGGKSCTGATYTGGGGGGFGSNGANYGCATGGVTYGNARLLPLIGGSGGGGGGQSTYGGIGGSAGGGGGAILIASTSAITVTGSITANGGNGAKGSYVLCDGGCGSGGGVKVIANLISGNGNITAKGGVISDGGNGGAGRIRIEAYTNNRTAGTDPPYTFGLPGSVFPANLPSLGIISIAGATVPANPTGAYNQPDMLLPGSTTNPVAVNISASNIPVGTTVKVWVLPQWGAATSVNTTLAGTDQSSTATANVNLSTTYSNIVTAEATFTTLQAMYWDGEEIEKVRVATTMGGESETVYITASGKEIPGDLIAGVYR